MNHAAPHYDLDCLRRLLEDTLPEPQAGEVAEHVADCAECRRQLESLAGQPQWWSQVCSGVKTILADPAAYLSRGMFGGQRSDRVAGSSCDSARDDSFATDFAVDFLEPTNDSAMLGRLGDYEILEVIGQGGMAIVLKGYQRELNRYVAVKVLAPHLALSAAARKRFAREAQAAAAVVHPHVMAIHAVAANAKLPYLVMPFVACESLQQRLDRHGPLDVKDVLRIGLQAASGLAAAHAQGLVHRDVKPANILLETSVDRVMLTDFGLARAVDDATLTRTGIIAGTPQYMSPEQAGGDPVDRRSDLFSLGSVLYAMCTGRPPFRAETTFGVLQRIRETPPRPIREINADIPAWFERIVLRLLSKDAADRIATATEVATLLEQCLAHVQQPMTVELPAFCSPVVHRQDNRGWQRLAELLGCRSVNEHKHSVFGFPLAKRRGYLVRSTLVIALMAISLGVFWARQQPPATSKAVTDSPAEQSTLDQLLPWDATQAELDATASVINSLEAHVQQDVDPLDFDRQEPTDSQRKEEP